MTWWSFRKRNGVDVLMLEGRGDVKLATGRTAIDEARANLEAGNRLVLHNPRSTTMCEPEIAADPRQASQTTTSETSALQSLWRAVDRANTWPTPSFAA